MRHTTTHQVQLHNLARAVAASLAVAMERGIPYDQIRNLLQRTRDALGNAVLPEPYATFLEQATRCLEHPRPVDRYMLQSVAQEAGIDELGVAQLLDEIPSHEHAEYYSQEYARAYAWSRYISWANELTNAIRNADYQRAETLLAQPPRPPAPNASRSEPLLQPLDEYLARYNTLDLEYIPLLGVDKLLARGTTTLLAAHPKAGKTTLLIHACRQWLQQGLRVAYLSEDPPVVWSLRLQRHPELHNLLISCAPRAHPERWQRAIREAQPDIVIVDTIRRFASIADESDPAKVAAALAYFIDLTRDLPRTAVLLAHHTRKSARADGDATLADVAGSHAFASEVDAILTLTRHEKNPRQRILKPIEGRLWLTAPEPLVLELAPDGSAYQVVGVDRNNPPAPQREPAEQAILDALQALESATADEIRDYLAQRGIDLTRQWIKRVLDQCVDAGTVQRVGGGAPRAPHRYSIPASPLCESMKPPLGEFHTFTNDNDPDLLTGDALADAILEIFNGWDVAPETRYYHLQHRHTHEQRAVAADSFQTACHLLGWLPDETALLKIERHAPA